MATIFISYRREDCPAHAGRLCDGLTARFGARSVFMDVDAIELGVDFLAKIEQAVGDCDVLLALIGDEWLGASDREGRRRLDLPDDFVRLEIATALARDDVRVVPVLVEGASIPSAAELPGDLAGLSRRNGVSLSDAKWRSDAAVLVRAIEQVVGAKGSAAVPAASAPPSHRAWTIAALCGYAFVWFLLVGLRLRERRLSIAGLVYAAAVLVLLVSGVKYAGYILDDDGRVARALLIWLVCAAPSAIHYFAVRPRYAAAAPG